MLTLTRVVHSDGPVHFDVSPASGSLVNIVNKKRATRHLTELFFWLWLLHPPACFSHAKANLGRGWLERNSIQSRTQLAQTAWEGRKNSMWKNDHVLANKNGALVILLLSLPHTKRKKHQRESHQTLRLFRIFLNHTVVSSVPAKGVVELTASCKRVAHKLLFTPDGDCLKEFLCCSEGTSIRLWTGNHWQHGCRWQLLIILSFLLDSTFGSSFGTLLSLLVPVWRPKAELTSSKALNVKPYSCHGSHAWFVVMEVFSENLLKWEQNWNDWLFDLWGTHF